MDMPPQNTSPYPPPPTSVAGEPGYVPPKIRFETIGEAWRLLQQQMGVWVGAMLIYLAVTAGIYIVGWIVLFPIFLAIAPHGDAGGMIAIFGMMGSFFLLMVLVIAASSVMMAGLYRMAIRQVRGEMIAVNDLFGAVDIAAPALLATLLIGLAGMIGGLFCVIPGYVVLGLLMLTLPIVVDRKLSPVDAMKESWNALRGDILMATLYLIVLSFVASLGAMACGIGMIVTMPLLFIGQALVYRDFFILPNPVPASYVPAYTPAAPVQPAPAAPPSPTVTPAAPAVPEPAPAATAPPEPIAPTAATEPPPAADPLIDPDVQSPMAESAAAEPAAPPPASSPDHEAGERDGGGGANP